MGHWIIDTAGIGSLIVAVVGLSVLGAYLGMVRWIHLAPRDGSSNGPAGTGDGERDQA